MAFPYGRCLYLAMQVFSATAIVIVGSFCVSYQPCKPRNRLWFSEV